MVCTVVYPNRLDASNCMTKFRIDSADCDATTMSSVSSLFAVDLWTHCDQPHVVAESPFPDREKIRVQLTPLRMSRCVQEDAAVQHLRVLPAGAAHSPAALLALT